MNRMVTPLRYHGPKYRLLKYRIDKVGEVNPFNEDIFEEDELVPN